MKLGIFSKVFVRSSRFAVRISRALSMPAFSLLRMAVRLVKSAWRASQPAIASSRKAMSAAFCSSVNSFCLLSSAMSSSTSASCSFFVSSVFSKMPKSSFISENQLLNAFPVLVSVALDSFWAASTCLYWSSRMPTMVMAFGWYLCFCWCLLIWTKLKFMTLPSVPSAARISFLVSVCVSFSATKSAWSLLRTLEPCSVSFTFSSSSSSVSMISLSST
mmetsp:Transcript_81263/g.143329  ORF Transcript_81263/g.143329 Transcript_81263/m.143329 type:complete len:218 (-) Transcript_81263:320-973(-)